MGLLIYYSFNNSYINRINSTRKSWFWWRSRRILDRVSSKIFGYLKWCSHETLGRISMKSNPRFWKNLEFNSPRMDYQRIVKHEKWKQLWKAIILGIIRNMGNILIYIFQKKVSRPLIKVGFYEKKEKKKKMNIIKFTFNLYEK